MARLSYLIATKNNGHIISETIESFLSQSDSDWEAVIVDDHGNDNTEEVINNYGDGRLKYFRLSDTHGHGECCARNYATILASSEVVAIMDSDDICYPNRNKITLDYFDKDTELDVFYGNLDIWEEESNIVRDRKNPIAPFSLERLKTSSFIPHPTVAMKRELLLRNPYNAYFRIASDYELMSRLASMGKKFSFTEEKILKYRLGNQNASAGSDLKQKITYNYDLLVKMLRGWADYDSEILSKIEKLEKEAGY
jgi:glycosyltransferase involved in cell wall biosynthesis